MNQANNRHIVHVAHCLAENAWALANNSLKGVMQQTLESFTNGCLAHAQYDASMIAFVALDCLAGERAWSDLEQTLKHTLLTTQKSPDDQEEDPS